MRSPRFAFTAPLAVALGVLSLPSPGKALAAGRGGDFCVLTAEENAGTFAIIDPNGKVVRRLTLGKRPHEVEVSPDGKTAFVSVFGITDYDSRIGTPGRLVAEIDLTSGRRKADYLLPPGVRAPHGVRLRPPQFHELYVNAESGGDWMVVFDTASHRVLRRFPTPPGAHNLVFSKDGAALFVMAGVHGVAKLDPDTGKVLASAEVGSPVRGLTISSGGTVLAGAKDAVVELRATDLKEIRRLPAPGQGQLVYLAQMDDGTILAPSMNKDDVVFFPPGGGPARFVATGKTPIHVAVAPDGRIFVANVQDSHVSVLSADGVPGPAIEGITSPNGLNFGVCPKG